MRRALEPFSRFIVTPRVSKHRLFVWLTPPTLVDTAAIVFARDDDYFFGILHSRPHELWALAQGTQLRERESGFRYTHQRCFETFPLPWPPGDEPADSPLVEAVAEAARRLNELREGWLNPEGPLVSEDELKRRTLTNLYNERPAWLDTAHRRLDEAVFNAYGWPPGLSDDEVLARLLALNQERAAARRRGSAPGFHPGSGLAGRYTVWRPIRPAWRVSVFAEGHTPSATIHDSATTKRGARRRPALVRCR